LLLPPVPQASGRRNTAKFRENDTLPALSGGVRVYVVPFLKREIFYGKNLLHPHPPERIITSTTDL